MSQTRDQRADPNKTTTPPRARSERTRPEHRTKPTKRTIRLLTLAALVSTVPAAALEPTGSPESTSGGPSWRLGVANDIVFGSDNQFTNGFSIQRHSPLASNHQDLRSLFLGKAIARLLPRSDDLYYRTALALGQNMQTPDDIVDPEIILNDVPYLGMLAVSSTATAFNDSRFTGLELLVGVVGPASQADEVQRWVHEVVDSDEPAGWGNQVDNEAILNLYFMRKRKLWSMPGLDGALSLDIAAGNLVTSGSLSLETRFGKKPRGFLYTPTPFGVTVRHDATLPDDRRTLVYGSLAVRATGYAFFMPRDGNTLVDDNPWTERNVLDPERYVGQVTLGFHLVRPRWGLHLNWWITTDTVDVANLAPGEDPSNDFGMITLETRW